MPTWKKIIVSGSQAELAAVTASIAVLVGTNQQITTAQSTTFLTGSFTGSFRGDGSALTNVASVAFPGTQLTPLVSTTRIFSSADGTATTYVVAGQITASAYAGISGDITVNASGVAALKSGIISSSAQISSSLFSGGTVTGGASLQLTGSSSNLSGSFSGSFQGLHTGNGSGLTNIPYSSLTSVPTGIVSGAAQFTAGVGQGTFRINSVATDTATIAGLGTGDSPTFASLTLTNNLTVQGTVTQLQVDNVLVEDKFILLNSGSVPVGDGGIIIQNAANYTGSAFYFSSGSITGNTGVGRWALAPAVASSATTATANSYVVAVSSSTALPTGDPLYGGSVNGHGNMYIKTDTGDIYIYA